MSWCPLRSPWGLSKCQCLRRPFDLVQAQVWSPWSPWDNGKSPKHPIECLSTPKIFYGSPVVSLVPQYHNLCPSTLQKCPWWVEEVARVQMTLSVVICVYWGHGTPRKGLATPQVMSWWILTLGGLLVWLRWLKKPMKPLAWWRSPWTHIWWLNGPCPIKGDDVVINDLMKTWNPWWRSWCSCSPCWGHGTLGYDHYAWEGLAPT